MVLSVHYESYFENHSSRLILVNRSFYRAKITLRSICYYLTSILLSVRWSVVYLFLFLFDFGILKFPHIFNLDVWNTTFKFTLIRKIIIFIEYTRLNFILNLILIRNTKWEGCSHLDLIYGLLTWYMRIFIFKCKCKSLCKNYNFLYGYSPSSHSNKCKILPHSAFLFIK